MYAARGRIQELTGSLLNDQYFTQVLLPNYIQDNGVVWDVVYDDRGHFTEPHGGQSFGLGTLNVRGYLQQVRFPRFVSASFADPVVDLFGPTANFGALLFIEKEGFMPLLEKTELAKRYDLAIMSSKGMSVTAARRLAEGICSQYRIPLLILHDFDRAGIIIKHTLHTDTRRYSFTSAFDVIDLGLGLDDIEDLESEDAGGSKISDEKLEEAGATPEEIEFLGERRVELNAMPSDEFITFLEDKLDEHGIRKIVPNVDTLRETYTLFAEGEELKAFFAQAQATFKAKAVVEIPGDFEKQVKDALKKDPEIPWHEAVRRIVVT
jgi:hypothetical protein